MWPRSERAKRYAQCHFVDMSVLKASCSNKSVALFYNFAKTTSSGVNIKQCTNVGNMCENEFHDKFANSDGTRL